MEERGLECDGTVAREGALERVQADFVPVVEAARAHITATFGARLYGAYLYGSIPRGTARPGVSDLDLLVVLHDEPTAADHADAAAIEAALDGSFPQINGVGMLLSSAGHSLSDLERYDGGFFIACLCTPLTGHDLAEQLPATALPGYSPARRAATSPFCSRAGGPEPGKPLPTLIARPSAAVSPAG